LRRRWAVAGLVLGSAVVVAGTVIARASDDKPSPLPAAEPLAAYRIAYRVEQPGGADIDEVHEVRRPFDSRVEQRQADGKLAVGTLTNDVGYWIHGDTPTPGWSSGPRSSSPAR